MAEDTPGICVPGNCPDDDGSGGSNNGGGGGGGGFGGGNNGETRVEERGVDYLRSRSLREVANENLMRPWNHRYRGHREGFKFNLHLQRLLAQCAYQFNTLKTKDSNLDTVESEVYPTDSEIALYSHVFTQIRFKEYLLMRDANVRWYV